MGKNLVRVGIRRTSSGLAHGCQGDDGKNAALHCRSVMCSKSTKLRKDWARGCILVTYRGRSNSLAIYLYYLSSPGESRAKRAKSAAHSRFYRLLRKRYAPNHTTNTAWEDWDKPVIGKRQIDLLRN